MKMHLLALSLTLVFVRNTLAIDYVINPDKKKDFDGIAITMLHKPHYCDKLTKKGDRLKVHFNASLPDGNVFESTWVKKKPFEFVIGDGMVINGFEYGLQDMCIGEKRFLMIPPKYAYGDWQLGSTVPARTTFHFYVELIDFTPNAQGKKSNLFRTIDANDDGLLSRDEVLFPRSEGVPPAGALYPKSHGRQMQVKRYLQNERLADKGDQMVQMLKDIFKMEDNDNNGFIDHKEFGGIKHDEF